MPEWTTQQENAINAKNRNILVSAAAGSGKTAVLVERVIKKITNAENPVDVDTLLIVTFTNAAAAEMKTRISKSLKAIIKDNPSDANAKRQLSLLSNAQICTIDSFCINLVRENFFSLGINQDFKNLDESELSLLEDEAIDEVLNDYFEKSDTSFIALTELFTTPNSDKPFVSAIKKILRFIYAQPFPYQWTNKMIQLYDAEIPFSNSVWYDYIHSEISYLLDYALNLVNNNHKLITDCLSYKDDKQRDNFLALADDDLTEVLRFKKANDKSWDVIVNERPAEFVRMPSSTKIEETTVLDKIKSSRDIYKSILKDDIPSFLISDEKQYKDELNYLQPILTTLAEIVREVDLKMMNTKLDKNAFSFSDIEHFAINLLFKSEDGEAIIKTALADELSGRFNEILVDEYQDTNEAQNLLFSYLSNGSNLFVVGDVKQSIYRFRLAMPDIFNNKRKAYTPYDEKDSEVSSKIILDKNFRSRKGICSYVNFIFSNIMSERVGELEYNKDEQLNNGAKYDEAKVSSAQIKILTNTKGELTNKKEAAFIAKTIKNKVNSGELIKDKDDYRPIRYSDFAILIRSLKSNVDNYFQVLSDYNIPVMCDNSLSLFDCNEVKIIMSLIRTIDNPTLEIPLAATMLSPIYSFTYDEVSKIRIENKAKSFYFSVVASKDEKVKNFIADLNGLRKLGVTMSVAGFIRYLVDSKGIVALVNAMDDGEHRYQNVLKLISFAENFDKGDNVGLTSFIRYIDKIISSDRTVESAQINNLTNDCVTIMSVHRSKGLEFPVCILAGSAKQYNKIDLYERLLLNTNYGFGLKCHNEDRLYQFPSIPYSVIKNKNSYELMSENLRVLYVALTRAKEQFITFVTCEDIGKRLTKLSGMINSGYIEPYICKKVNNDADFILMCALLHKDGQELRDLCGSLEEPLPSDFDMQIEVISDIDLINTENSYKLEPYEESIIEKIKEKISYKYERDDLSKMSAKLTASALDAVDNGFEYITSSKPAFMNKSEMTPAQRGTAMHTFMQFCDYGNAKASLDNEITRLYDLGFLSKEQADCLDKSKLNTFFSGDFAKRMFASSKIYREIKVSSFVKASDIYDTDFDDEILVQGIADCVFEENGKLILVDYKTDNVKSSDELLEHYRKQITFYRYAIEKTLKKPVSQAVLYSFSLQKVCIYK